MSLGSGQILEGIAPGILSRKTMLVNIQGLQRQPDGQTLDDPEQINYEDERGCVRGVLFGVALEATLIIGGVVCWRLFWEAH